jgi:N-acetyl-gamma-glutamyl-phosphate reductase/acetylglutamate kinase
MASFAAARRVASSSAAPRRALTSLASATVPKRLQPSSAEIALSLSASQVGPALRQRGLSSVSDVAKMDRETILRLLHSLGTRNEVERYLRIFTSSTGAVGTGSGVLPQAKFAVLKYVSMRFWFSSIVEGSWV